MIKKLLFATLLLILCASASHPLKMCVCDVKHLPESQQLSLKFKFFWDDLEASLEKHTGQSLDLKSPSAQTRKVLDDFLRKNFFLKINGQTLPLRFERSEFQEPILLVEWRVDHFKPTTQYNIELQNQILLDVFSDQYNMVRFDFFGDGNLETLRFERTERFLTKIITKR